MHHGGLLVCNRLESDDNWMLLEDLISSSIIGCTHSITRGSNHIFSSDLRMRSMDAEHWMSGPDQNFSGPNLAGPVIRNSGLVRRSGIPDRLSLLRSVARELAVQNSIARSSWFLSIAPIENAWLHTAVTEKHPTLNWQGTFRNWFNKWEACDSLYLTCNFSTATFC